MDSLGSMVGTGRLSNKTNLVKAQAWGGAGNAAATAAFASRIARFERFMPFRQLGRWLKMVLWLE
jgi:hypothetical protein